MQLNALLACRPDFETMCDPVLESLNRMQAQLQQRLETHLNEAEAVLDHARLQAHLTRLAQAGVGPAQTRLAELLEASPDNASAAGLARGWYEKAANQGEAAAQRWMGYDCRSKHQLAEDEKAFSWFSKAARQQDMQSELALALCHFSGTGTPKNGALALKRYLQAAAQGSVEAQCNAALCYLEGIGTEMDATEAVRRYRLAADKGSALAQFKLSGCYMRGKGVEQNLGAALEWCLKSAVAGHPDAQFSIGWCYEKGLGVAPDLNTAMRWYAKAAAAGGNKYVRSQPAQQAPANATCVQQ